MQLGQLVIEDGTKRRLMNKSSGQSIGISFPITEEEYVELDKKYGSLANFAAWQLYKKNSRNNHTDEQVDIAQDLRIALLRAGSYYKRQVYIEECLELCEQYAEDGFLKLIIKELRSLWKNKTRHGANRQKFGPLQEQMLDKITHNVIPSEHQPNRKAPLRIDGKFSTYCKAICWNSQKAMGRKITREKSLRVGLCSLSEFDYLAHVDM